MITISRGTVGRSGLYLSLAVLALSSYANPALAQYAGSYSQTHISVSSDCNPAVIGSAVTFTAFVSGWTGSAPTGTVTFYDGSAFLWTSPIGVNGTAAISTSRLILGSQEIFAEYGGDANNGSAISPPLTQLALNASTPTYGGSMTNYGSWYYGSMATNDAPWYGSMMTADDAPAYYQPISSHWYGIVQGNSRSFYPYLHRRYCPPHAYPFTSSPPWWY